MDKPSKAPTAAHTTAAQDTGLEGSAALSPIDSTKLSPPRIGTRILARERLHTQLFEARRRRCIVLKGPAGCGKTTAMASWRQMQLSLGFDVAWLTLTSGDNQLSRFLDYLLASLAQVDPTMVRDTLLLEGYSSDREAVERTVITLVRGIAAHPRELVLVLDDLHTLTDTSIHQTLQWLLDYAPDNLHLALVSRSSVPLSLARLRSQNLTLELDLRDLRFTAEEAEQFLKTQLGEIDPSDIQRIYRMTDGWIAGLQLVAASRKKGRQRKLDGAASGQPQAQLLDNQAFSNFFETEVLSQLTPAELELLRPLALCERFCPALCATLVNRTSAVVDAAALFERLESDNLFLIAVDSADREAWYRFHPLLRETLLKLFEAGGEAEQRAVHARAWTWFRDRDLLSEAVGHAVHGGEAGAAAKFVEQRLETLYAQGDLRMLVELVRQLPMEQLQASVSLRMLLVRMQIYARDFAACVEGIERLERDIPESAAEVRFRLTMLRAILAVQRDDTDAAVAILPQLLHPPKNADAVMIGGSTNVLSWLYMHCGEFELARRIQLDRPPLLINGTPLLGTTGGSLQGRCLIGLSLAMEGQMNQAERIYREVLFEAERGGKTCFDARCLATALLGEVLYENGEVEAAYQLLVNWVDIFERVSIPDSVLRVLEVLAKTRWFVGDHKGAFAYLRRLQAYASKLGLDRLEAHSLVTQVHWHLQMGERSAAETARARLDAIDACHPNAERSSLRAIHILAEHAHVRWLAASGDLDGASLRLNQVIALCESGGRQLGVTRLNMLGAVFDAQRRLMDAAREKVLAALRAGHRYGQVRSLLDAHPEALALISQIAEGETLDPVLTFYVERLQAAALPAAAEAVSRKPDASRKQLSSGLETLSARELEILRLLAQALPNKKIARALALSPETVKWYLRHIFTKLGVTTRDEAVARLREVELSAGEGRDR
ncbi:helix-turn-helix transcriptional regulator [Pseudomonas cavernae]|uniref:Helix-turn-helix transcriptional regulator n=1 Tax=Pseudomonas cavernae TaxID=2320867 RepID=A0A385Z4W8_9PSED|nr:LuxR C-terminal-related transcriptional regulator [Pseudomonas cavernae]AYC32748.1 helix-turn-helix transcriptional regulator [Pseudomonas cavernae]